MICGICKKEKPFAELTKNYVYTRKDGTQTVHFICRFCNTLRSRKHRATKRGARNAVKRSRRYEKRHPEKFAAQKAARIIPMKPCEKCGTTIKVHRHHDDYSKPLEVRFLCPFHHREYHDSFNPPVSQIKISKPKKHIEIDRAAYFKKFKYVRVTPHAHSIAVKRAKERGVKLVEHASEALSSFERPLKGKVVD